MYPSAYLKRQEEPGQHNALANICMLPAAENNEISDNDPHTYLPECIQGLGSQADLVFESNFLPPPQQFSYRTAGFEEFLDARAALIAPFIQKLVGDEKP